MKKKDQAETNQLYWEMCCWKHNACTVYFLCHNINKQKVITFWKQIFIFIYYTLLMKFQGLYSSPCLHKTYEVIIKILIQINFFTLCSWTDCHTHKKIIKYIVIKVYCISSSVGIIFKLLLLYYLFWIAIDSVIL